MHGWNERSYDEGPTTVLGAYLLRKSDLNVGFVNWQPYAFSTLLEIVPRINPIANATVTILKGNSAFDPTKTHLVGYSVGAFIAGKIARTFNDSGKTFARLTALDPTNFYSTLDLIYRLNNVAKVSTSDAKFVDVIHSNAGSLGDSDSKGHVDFWPSGGKRQPNCDVSLIGAFKSICEFFVNFISFSACFSYPANRTVFNYLGCSHMKAWKYYAESINRTSSSPGFVASECDSRASSFSSTSCKTTTAASMGFYADSTTTNRDNKKTVNYFVDVNASPPYSKN